VDTEKHQLSLTNNLKNLPDLNYVPKEELMLSKLVEQDEDLKNNILQIILYQLDIETIVNSIMKFSWILSNKFTESTYSKL